MKENKEQAFKDGYELGLADAEYRRSWPCDYVTGSAKFAMTRGYEQAWEEKRNK